MITTVETKPPVRRRGFHISLRVFMLLVLLAGAWLGWKANRASRIRRAVAAIRQLKGMAYYDYEVDEWGNLNPTTRAEPRWLQRLLGPECFHDVHAVDLDFGSFVLGTPSKLNDLGFLADLGELRYLRLVFSGMDDATMSQMPPLPRLKTFILIEIHIGDDGLKWIAGCRELEMLQIRSDPAGDPTARMIATLPNLRDLNYNGHGTTEDGVEAFSCLSSLDRLEVYGKALGDRSLAAVSDLPNLEYLALWNLTRATPEWLGYLGKLTKLRNLTLLGPSDSVWNMASLAGKPKLWTLHVAYTTLGSASFSAFPSELPLTRVSTFDTDIDDSAIDALIRARTLKNLDLTETYISKEALLRLSQERPDMTVSQMGTPRPKPAAPANVAKPSK